LRIAATVPGGRELGWALLAGVVIYFAPTLLAVARHRGAAPLTFSFNLFLGWTGIGWVMAWLLALADRRLRIQMIWPQQAPAVSVSGSLGGPTITLAPDGRHWWDGAAWRDGGQVAPLGAIWSPDGAQWFTGSQWVSLSAAADPNIDSRPSGGKDGLPEEPEWWRRGR
jgi:hypothetical protein